MLSSKVSNKKLLDIVADCLSEDPMTRPSTAQIRSVVQELEKRSRVFVQGETHFLLKDRITVGSSPICDVRIDDPWRFIDDVHAIVKKEGDSWYILDNNSKNGVFVRKADKLYRVEESPLFNGSYLAIGYSENKGSHVSLRFRDLE